MTAPVSLFKVSLPRITQLASLFVVVASIPFLFSPATAAENPFDVKVPTIKQRLNKQIQKVQDFLDQLEVQSVDTDSKEAVAALIENIDYDESLRSGLTKLQDSLRVISGMKPLESLKPFQEEAKAFEDHISHVRDDKAFYADAIAAQNGTEQKYKDLLDENIAKYTTFMKTSAWFKGGSESFGAKVAAEVDRIENSGTLPTPVEERDLALTEFAKVLKKIQAKVYDFNEVETGIHELRRDLRRFSYLADGYKGLIQTDYNTCPLNGNVASQPKPVKGQYVCQVSSCLTDKLSYAVSDLAGIKTDGMGYLVRGEEVPGSLIESAAVIHQKIMETKVLGFIESQLRACMTVEKAVAQ